jgi:hypothetical protein
MSSLRKAAVNINKLMMIMMMIRFHSNRQYKALVGTAREDNGGTLYDIEKIIVHEDYSSATQDYDICLLKLTDRIIFGPKVSTIEIADSSFKIKQRSLVDITGWGDTKVRGWI